MRVLGFNYMLERVPPEVLALISSFCAQADLVSLAIAYPPCADAVLRDIYRCIIVDPVPRKLHGNRATKLALTDGNKPQLCSATTVTTLAGIKRLLATLSESPKYARMVRSFTVRGNISMSNNILIPRVTNVLRLLEMIQEFEWTACPELPPHALSKLGNRELLSLRVDLAFHVDQELPCIKFPYLQTLCVRPFLKIEALVWLRQMVSDNTDLQHLEISRYLDMKATSGSGFSFLGTSDVDCQNNHVNAVSAFFSHAQSDCSTALTPAPYTLKANKWKLKTLNLIQIDTSNTDVAALASKADISNLSELRLVGTGRECEHDHQLLRHIVQQRPQLERCELNWGSSIVSQLQLITHCCRKVRALKLTIKEKVYPMLDYIVLNCVELNHLEIDIDCDFNLPDLAPLKRLKKIQFLRLPYRPFVDSWEIALAIPHLKVLQLMNNSSGARSGSSSLYSQAARQSASMGLLTNGILGNWNDQLHSPFKCANILSVARANPSIEYVIVDDHVMNLKVQARALEAYRW